MMKLQLFTLGLFILLPVHFWGHASAQSLDGESNAPTTDRPPRVAVIRRDATLLVSVNEIAKALGWEAKEVVPGKLLTFCRSDDDSICIPIRLDKVTYFKTSSGSFLEAATLERALHIAFMDVESDFVDVVHAYPHTKVADDRRGYNAAWGPGRGFGVGQTLPDIPLLAVDGREVRFSEFLGKRFVIYCWASW